MSDTPPRRHRLRKIALWIAGIAVLVPAALVLLVLIAANTGPGRRLIESQAASLSGGMVSLHGLSGRFPDALRVAHLAVRDTKGIWLTLDDLALDWSPLELAGRDASISRLSAARVEVARLPVAAPAAKPAPQSSGFSLPVHVDLASLQVARLTLGPAVAGHAAVLRITGTAHIATLDDARARLAIDRLDAPGTYSLDGKLDAQAINAVLDAAEPSGGLVSGLAAIPALGELKLHATIAGPRSAERTDLTLAAGDLHASAHGTVNLVGKSAALDVDATAPAMAPRPDLSWDSIALTAHVHGPFATPELAAHADLRGVHGGGATIPSLVLEASGNRGAVDAHAVLTGLILPPPQPNLFTASPLDLTVHAQLDQPSLPIRFTLTHPLITADGTAQARGDITARLHTVIPSLAPFAAIGHVDIQGATEAVATLARHGQVSDVTVDGTARFTGGLAPLPTLLGATTYGATARLDGQDFTISRAVVDGRAAHADATGTDLNGTLAMAWHVVLRDLAALSPKVTGKLDAAGRVDGAPGGLALQADIKGDVGTATLPRGPITAAIRAQGLPANPSGTVAASGRLAGAPVTLDARLDREPDGAFHAVLKRADWRSLAVTADLLLAKGQTLPTGKIVARLASLADLNAFISQRLAGGLIAHIAIAPSAGRPDARIDVQATNLAAGKNAIARLSLTGHVADPAANPDVSLALAAEGIDAAGITGQAHATAAGPQTALLLHTDATLAVQSSPATLSAAARLDLPAHQITLATLTAGYKAETLRLRAPARIDFGATTAVDALRLAVGPPGTAPATLDVAGRIAPTLSLTAALRGVTPELARPFAPTLRASGLITADARLSGTTAAPQGTLRLQAANLHLRSGPAASLPPAALLATAELRGTAAQISARLTGGPKLSLTASGTAPLQAGGALALRATGTTDLTLLDPVLGATGKRAAGNLAFDATIAGTTAAPRIAGTATLDRGEIQDYAQGAHITAITARLSAAGDTVHIDRFTARAGPGTLGASGTIGVFAPGIPVSLRLTADHARPLSSDLLTATLDASLAVQGQASGTLDATGKILIRQAEINIPNALPPSVAVLHVRRPGDKPPPPPTATTTSLVRLGIELDAPSNIFVRGHGLDSELGGKLTIAGTTAAPQISGGFEMRHGSISVAGTTLTFTKGEVGFDGTSVTNKIDPTLDFVADSFSGSVEATLTVGGYADAPTIKLSSVPDLPQDEVLAHLLFGTSVKDLSAIQIAEIAAALAELSGVTGGGGDPLGAVRKGLGLDRLSVGGGGGPSSGATVEAGRYVARGVFIGAKQATSGGGTAAEVQIDLTRHLKAKAQLSTGGGSVQGATPDNDPGSTIGLAYQFEY